MLPPNQKCVRLWKGWSSISADAVVDAPGILALQVSLGLFCWIKEILKLIMGNSFKI